MLVFSSLWWACPKHSVYRVARDSVIDFPGVDFFQYSIVCFNIEIVLLDKVFDFRLVLQEGWEDITLWIVFSVESVMSFFFFLAFLFSFINFHLCSEQPLPLHGGKCRVRLVHSKKYLMNTLGMAELEC